MPRASLRSVPRKHMPSNRGTRSRAEAAIELVRLEYERERLVTGLTAANRNLATLNDSLASVENRIDQINNILVPERAVSPVKHVERRGSLDQHEFEVTTSIKRKMQP